MNIKPPKGLQKSTYKGQAKAKLKTHTGKQHIIKRQAASVKRMGHYYLSQGQDDLLNYDPNVYRNTMIEQYGQSQSLEQFEQDQQLPYQMLDPRQFGGYDAPSYHPMGSDRAQPEAMQAMFYQAASLTDIQFNSRLTTEMSTDEDDIQKLINAPVPQLPSEDLAASIMTQMYSLQNRASHGLRHTFDYDQVDNLARQSHFPVVPDFQPESRQSAPQRRSQLNQYQSNIKMSENLRKRTEGAEKLEQDTNVHFNSMFRKPPRVQHNQTAQSPTEKRNIDSKGEVNRTQVPSSSRQVKPIHVKNQTPARKILKISRENSVRSDRSRKEQSEMLEELYDRDDGHSNVRNESIRETTGDLSIRPQAEQRFSPESDTFKYDSEANQQNQASNVSKTLIKSHSQNTQIFTANRNGGRTGKVRQPANRQGARQVHSLMENQLEDQTQTNRRFETHQYQRNRSSLVNSQSKLKEDSLSQHAGEAAQQAITNPDEFIRIQDEDEIQLRMRIPYLNNAVESVSESRAITANNNLNGDYYRQGTNVSSTNKASSGETPQQCRSPKWNERTETSPSNLSPENNILNLNGLNKSQISQSDHCPFPMASQSYRCGNNNRDSQSQSFRNLLPDQNAVNLANNYFCQGSQGALGQLNSQTPRTSTGIVSYQELPISKMHKAKLDEESKHSNNSRNSGASAESKGNQSQGEKSYFHQNTGGSSIYTIQGPQEQALNQNKKSLEPSSMLRNAATNPENSEHNVQLLHAQPGKDRSYLKTNTMVASGQEHSQGLIDQQNLFIDHQRQQRLHSHGGSGRNSNRSRGHVLSSDSHKDHTVHTFGRAEYADNIDTPVGASKVDPHQARTRNKEQAYSSNDSCSSIGSIERANTFGSVGVSALGNDQRSGKFQKEKRAKDVNGTQIRTSKSSPSQKSKTNLFKQSEHKTPEEVNSAQFGGKQQETVASTHAPKAVDFFEGNQEGLLIKQTNFEDLSAMQQHSAPVKSSDGKREAAQRTAPADKHPEDRQDPASADMKLPEKRVQSEAIQQSPASQKASDALMAHAIADDEQATIEQRDDILQQSNGKGEPGQEKKDAVMFKVSEHQIQRVDVQMEDADKLLEKRPADILPETAGAENITQVDEQMDKMGKDLEEIAPGLKLVVNGSGPSLAMNPGETEWDDMDQPHGVLMISEKIPKTTSIHPDIPASKEEEKSFKVSANNGSNKRSLDKSKNMMESGEIWKIQDDESWTNFDRPESSAPVSMQNYKDSSNLAQDFLLPQSKKSIFQRAEHSSPEQQTERAKDKATIRAASTHQQVQTSTSAIPQAAEEKPPLPPQGNIAAAKQKGIAALKSIIETSLSAAILSRMRQLEVNVIKPEQPAGIISVSGALAEEPKMNASGTEDPSKAIIVETASKIDIIQEHQPINLFVDIISSFEQKTMEFEKPRVWELAKWESFHRQEDRNLEKQSILELTPENNFVTEKSSEQLFRMMSDAVDAKKLHLVEYVNNYKREGTDFGRPGELEGDGRTQLAPGAVMIAQALSGEVEPGKPERPSAFPIEELIYGPMAVAVTKTLDLLKEQQRMDKVNSFPTLHTIKSPRTMHQSHSRKLATRARQASKWQSDNRLEMLPIEAMQNEFPNGELHHKQPQRQGLGDGGRGIESKTLLPQSKASEGSSQNSFSRQVDKSPCSNRGHEYKKDGTGSDVTFKARSKHQSSTTRRVERGASARSVTLSKRQKWKSTSGPQQNPSQNSANNAVSSSHCDSQQGSSCDDKRQFASEEGIFDDESCSEVSEDRQMREMMKLEEDQFYEVMHHLEDHKNRNEISMSLLSLDEQDGLDQQADPRISTAIEQQYQHAFLKHIEPNIVSSQELDELESKLKQTHVFILQKPFQLISQSVMTDPYKPKLPQQTSFEKFILDNMKSQFENSYIAKSAVKSGQMMYLTQHRQHYIHIKPALYEQLAQIRYNRFQIMMSCGSPLESSWAKQRGHQHHKSPSKMLEQYDHEKTNVNGQAQRHLASWKRKVMTRNNSKTSASPRQGDRPKASWSSLYGAVKTTAKLEHGIAEHFHSSIISPSKWPGRDDVFKFFQLFNLTEQTVFKSSEFFIEKEGENSSGLVKQKSVLWEKFQHSSQNKRAVDNKTAKDLVQQTFSAALMLRVNDTDLKMVENLGNEQVNSSATRPDDEEDAADPKYQHIFKISVFLRSKTFLNIFIRTGIFYTIQMKIQKVSDNIMDVIRLDYFYNLKAKSEYICQLSKEKVQDSKMSKFDIGFQNTHFVHNEDFSFNEHIHKLIHSKGHCIKSMKFLVFQNQHDLIRNRTKPTFSQLLPEAMVKLIKMASDSRDLLYKVQALIDEHDSSSSESTQSYTASEQKLLLNVNYMKYVLINDIDHERYKSLTVMYCTKYANMSLRLFEGRHIVDFAMDKEQEEEQLFLREQEKVRNESRHMPYIKDDTSSDEEDGDEVYAAFQLSSKFGYVENQQRLGFYSIFTAEMDSKYQLPQQAKLEQKTKVGTEKSVKQRRRRKYQKRSQSLANDKRRDSLQLPQLMHYMKNEKGEVVAFPTNLNRARATKGPDADEHLQNSQKFKRIDSESVIERAAYIFKPEDGQTSTGRAAVANKAQMSSQEAPVTSNPADDDSSEIVSNTSSIFESTRIAEVENEGSEIDAEKAGQEKKIEFRPVPPPEERLKLQRRNTPLVLSKPSFTGQVKPANGEQRHKQEITDLLRVHGRRASTISDLESIQEEPKESSSLEASEDREEVKLGSSMSFSYSQRNRRSTQKSSTAGIFGSIEKKRASKEAVILEELLDQHQEGGPDGSQPSEANQSSLLLRAPALLKFKAAATKQQRTNSAGLAWASLSNKEKMQSSWTAKIKASESGSGPNVNEATAITKNVVAPSKLPGPAVKKEIKDKNQLLQIVDIVSDGDLDERPTSFRNISIHSQMARDTALKKHQQILAEVDVFMNELKSELDNDKDNDCMKAEQLLSENQLHKSFTIKDNGTHPRQTAPLNVNLPILDLGAVVAQSATKTHPKMSIFSPIVQSVDISPESKKKNVDIIMKDTVSIDLQMSDDELNPMKFIEINSTPRGNGRERAFSFRERDLLRQNGLRSESRAVIQFEKFEKLSNSCQSESHDNTDVSKPQISELSLGSPSEESDGARADLSHASAQVQKPSQLSHGEHSLLDSGEERRMDLEMSQRQQKKNLERLKRNLQKRRQQEQKLTLTLKTRKMQFFSPDHLQRAKATTENDEMLVLLNSLKPVDEPGNGDLHGWRLFRHIARKVCARLKLTEVDAMNAFKDVAKKAASTVTRQRMNQIDQAKLYKAIEQNQTSVIQDFCHYNVLLIDMQNEEGYTMLAYATHHGRVQIVDILLRAGANPNIPTYGELNTPLHLAVDSNFRKIQDLLIDTFADESQQNQHGLTPWQGLLPSD